MLFFKRVSAILAVTGIGVGLVACDDDDASAAADLPRIERPAIESEEELEAVESVRSDTPFYELPPSTEKVEVEEQIEPTPAEPTEAQAAESQTLCMTAEVLEEELPAIHNDTLPGTILYITGEEGEDTTDRVHVTVVGDVLCEEGWLFANISAEQDGLEGMAILQYDEVNGRWVDYGGLNKGVSFPGELPKFIRGQFG